MAKNKYDNYSKEQLIAKLKQLEKKQRFGLVWEDKPEDIADQCERELPVLVEDKSKEIISDPKKPTHFIFEGDNYHTLYTLNFTHKKKIDVIYIDPPYNTGNKKEWLYNDHWIDENDRFRHSKWLSFMSKRLRLAKNLLKDGASIFISIGDDEVANLKLLCDKIFGANNFITLISRISKTASNKGKYFAPSCDYVLLYTKNAESLKKDSFSKEVNSDLYRKDDNDGLGMYRDDVALYQSSLDTRPNQRYYIECPDGSLVIPPGNVFPDTKEDACFVLPKSNDDKVWRWSYPTYLQQKDLLVFKESKRSPLLNEVGKQARYNIYTKSYLNERQKKGVKPRNFLIGKEFLNRKGTDHIKKMGIKFNYSKPTALIDDLIISTNTNKNAVILDFFAGSGTTGEVVIELNKKDKGNRQFILCTNNENNICEEVTYPRMKAIINGYGKKKGIPANIKYYKTDFVPFALTDNDKRTLVAKSTELLCIAESTFEVVQQNIKKLDYAIFKNVTKQTAIIYDEDCIEKCCTELNKTKSKHKTIIYVFSYDHTYEEDDFENLKIDFVVKPIPEAIINVYRKISKLKNK